MLKKIFKTSDDFVLTIVRVTLGFTMFLHGAQKMFGWFGGFGYSGTMGFFVQKMGIPAPLAFLAIAAEFFGGLGLIAGLLGRIASAGVITNMVVAAILVHLPNGFFMNWYANQKGEGFEYHLLAIALGLAVLIKGSGALSLDRWISEKIGIASKPALSYKQAA